MSDVPVRRCSSWNAETSYQRDFRIHDINKVHEPAVGAFFIIMIFLDYHNIYNMTWEKQEVQESGKITKFAKKRIIYMLPFLPSLGISFSL